MIDHCHVLLGETRLQKGALQALLQDEDPEKRKEAAFASPAGSGAAREPFCDPACDPACDLEKHGDRVRRFIKCTRHF